jgi:hypothetical protein
MAADDSLYPYCEFSLFPERYLSLERHAVQKKQLMPALFEMVEKAQER